MRDREIEIARFFHQAPAEICGKVLQEAGISFRLSDDSLTADVSALGRASNPTCIVLVPESVEVQAREALLENARKETVHGVDPSHPMTTWGDEDLAKTLAEASEWSPYEVAVAEKLLHDRGLAAPPVRYASATEIAAFLENRSEEPARHQEPLPGEQSANPWVIGFGFLMASIGALGTLLFFVPATLLAMVIACDSMFSSRVNAQGERRYVHHPRARMVGVVLFLYALLVFCMGMSFHLHVRLSRG